MSALILSTTLAVVVWLLVYKRGKKRRRSRKISVPGASLPSWKVFTKEELRSITKNFSEGNRLVGDTKTGGTYSGVLSDGSRVAVKRLKRTSFQRKKEFYSEISRVARLRYPNLVAVMGCCYDHGDRYIVYEFVANGPLDKWLHHIPRGGRSLDWAMRMKIATTLAQGIAYVQNILFILLTYYILSTIFRTPCSCAYFTQINKKFLMIQFFCYKCGHFGYSVVFVCILCNMHGIMTFKILNFTREHLI